jgi:CHAT domain-containing protein
VVGLSRAFLMAGSERLLLSLWQISAEGTRVFMLEFYRLLLSNPGADVSAVLRKTQALMAASR